MVSQVGIIVGVFSALLVIGILLMYCHLKSMDDERSAIHGQRHTARGLQASKYLFPPSGAGAEDFEGADTDAIDPEGIREFLRAGRGRQLDQKWGYPRTPAPAFAGRGTGPGRGFGGDRRAANEFVFSGQGRSGSFSQGEV